MDKGKGPPPQGSGRRVGDKCLLGREVEMGLDRRSRGGVAANAAVESELACDGRGLVGTDNGNSTGHGGKEGPFPGIRLF